MSHLYPVQLTSDGIGFLVQFPEISEAITYVDCLEQVNVMAADAVLAAFDFYFEDLREIPSSSLIAPEQLSVELPRKA